MSGWLAPNPQQQRQMYARILAGGVPPGGSGWGDTTGVPAPLQVLQPSQMSQGAALAQTGQALMDWRTAQRAKSVQMGLLDPATGWPTKAGWLSAGQQYGNALLAGSVAPEARVGLPRLNPDAVGFADRISTRQPSMATDVHDTAGYTIDRGAFDAAGTKGPYAGRVDEVLPRHIGLTDHTPEGLVNHISDNLRAIYDAVPKDWKQGAMNWYDGARTLAETMADRFGTSARAQAANLAALSPQRMWEHNVEQAMRVGNIVGNHADSGWTPQLEAAWKGTPDAPGFAETNPKWSQHYDNIQGKTLSEISDPTEAAMWVRLHDRANAEHNNVQIVKPDGTLGDFLTNKDGSKSALQWGSLDAVGNAVSVLRDDSLGNISQAMGEGHKVRNFYNNIVSPNAGHDVTIDTHAIAAGLLRPLGSSNPEVSYGLGSPVGKEYRTGADIWPSTMANAPEGVAGLYPLYADAYRRVADELNIHPRQLQSVVWEGIRGLYNDVDRRNTSLINNNSDIWKAVNDGSISADDARTQILSRGIRTPNWVGKSDAGPAVNPAASAPAATPGNP